MSVMNSNRVCISKALEDNAHVRREANSASKDQGGKGGAKGKNDLSASTKNTKLKRRGEEDTCIEYIGISMVKYA